MGGRPLKGSKSATCPKITLSIGVDNIASMETNDATKMGANYTISVGEKNSRKARRAVTRQERWQENEEGDGDGRAIT